jgi:cytochrome c peroxidase
MKHLKTAVISLMAVALMFTAAYGATNAERGKALFNDPKAFGATGNTSCATCHPNGKGLETSGKWLKRSFVTPGAVWLKLQDAINFCIIMANKGKAIDPRSQDMKDLVSYIRQVSRENTEPPAGYDFNE